MSAWPLCVSGYLLKLCNKVEEEKKSCAYAYPLLRWDFALH